jgi:hypothetical protein
VVPVMFLDEDVRTFVVDWHNPQANHTMEQTRVSVLDGGVVLRLRAAHLWRYPIKTKRLG